MTTAAKTQETAKAAPPNANFIQLFDMLSGYWKTQAVYAAAKLGIPDLLISGPRTSDDMAAELNANPDFLHRLLRTLATVGLFKEVGPKTYQQTDMSNLLRSDVPNSMRPMTLMSAGDNHYRAWGHLAESIQTGKFAFEAVYGMNIFDYMATNAEASEAFNNAMSSFVKNIHTAVMKHYDFSGIKTLADIGGGHGLFIVTILKEYPNLEGVLFDLPHVVTGADQYLKSMGVESRCKVVGGDFFKGVAKGADAYIMSHIIHDWSDDHCISILKNIHQAMTADGKLLVVENMIRPTTEGRPSMAPWMDLNMLVMTQGGRERTEAEFRTLFAQGGFELKRVIPTTGEHVILESVKK